MTSAPPPNSGGTDPATKKNQEGLLREKGGVITGGDTDNEGNRSESYIVCWCSSGEESFEKIQRRHYESGRST
ncbi:hypothetical protein F2Q69_00048959 [Brassica cretica]|uniref:Uncharacterized protein n=1 Tax=Brassica cretica TaxID=69181 RepID=A0A8S9PQU4_BRACR|nr:hypothetical protein F2Q69_00048959 [Brassica cretica]